MPGRSTAARENIPQARFSVDRPGKHIWWQRNQGYQGEKQQHPVQGQMLPGPVSVWERPGHSTVPARWDECCSASGRAMSAAAGQTRQGGSPTPSSPFPEACLFLFCYGCVKSYLLAFLLWQRSLLSQLLQICLWSLAMSIALGHQLLWEMSGWHACVLQLQLGERLMSSRRARPGVG